MVKKEKIVFGKLNLMRNDLLDGKPKIKIGFVGGGPNSFIGYSHRLASRFDNRFDFVAGESAKGLLEISLVSNIPIINGILTTNNFKQAEERSKSEGRNKGWDAMEAALQTINVYQKI